MTQTVSETTQIAAPPAAVYAAVADVAGMGRWSPECTGADVKGGPDAEVRVGTRFTGRNRGEKGRPWSTACTVTVADPGERFAFEVKAAGMRVAVWSYTLEPAEGGSQTRITETWIDQRGPLMTWIGTLATGVKDRVTHNRETMKVTLRRLKEELEGEPQNA
ncbi:SRPBCC family protein [Streptomyces sp. NA04227]|uniref:SRPBCC family protein n=1 Tax=Streptomyces sp. NA04227 TaxID=2742136 RepID=UPI001590728D|nr:SRPBCC family protein [Streptomyces sp. NA04227]QKW09763.1 SRPBCC family protein [Streptomyces sp. NA04227]